jgi:hypothetical protein
VRLLSRAPAVCALVFGPAVVVACESPQSYVVFDNDYPLTARSDLVIFQAQWQAVSLQQPIAPGASSGPQDTVPASENTAYVLVAPGLDPPSPRPPATFLLLQSRTGFSVHLGDTVHIPVDDTTFAGNCAAGSPLTQEQADFITQTVFSSAFAGLHYDAASCTTSLLADAGTD